MKLFYSPGSCSLAPHILIREAGLDVEPVRVVTGPEGKAAGGRDYFTINPLGSVPTLEFDDGDILAENAVILQYLAGLAPEQRFGPPESGQERWHFLERLHFVSTELHKGFSPLFRPYIQGEVREAFVKALSPRFEVVDKILERTPWLTGQDYGIVDIYAFVTLRWSERHNVDLAPWPQILAFKQKVASRPAVHQAMREQGLI